jgi:hypothetical protein
MVKRTLTAIVTIFLLAIASQASTSMDLCLGYIYMHVLLMKA